MDNTIPQKCCIRCNVLKPRDDFYDNGRQNHLPPEVRCKQTICKDCQKVQRIAYKNRANELRRISRKAKKRDRRAEWRKYWSIDEYEAMWEAQNGVCAICKCPETTINNFNPHNTRRLSVDHDHKTGKVRRLLCHRCNVAVGKYENHTSYFRSIVSYLEQD